MLKADDPSTWKKDPDMTWGDKFLHPSRPLNQRQRELCRLAAHGKTNNEIAELLSYTPSRVCILLSSRKIKDEVEHYRDMLFGADVQTRLKEMSSDALNVMDNILTSQNIPAEDKEAAAKWVLEKTTGKPAQQVDVRQEISVGVFLDQLDKMKQVGSLPPPPAAIDIIPVEEGDAEPAEAEKADTAGFSDWLTKNL